MKYIATATRKNLFGKKDYRWVHKNSNGSPVLFNSAKDALICAVEMCANPAHNLYAPKQELFATAPWNHNAPVNPFFAGAERPRLSQDY